MPHAARIEALRRSLKKYEGFLVTDLTNVRYLTGFSGSSGFFLLTKGEAVFATDFRYEEQARAESGGAASIVIEKGSRTSTIKRLARKTGLKKLLIESSVSYEFFRRLSGALPLKAVKGKVEALRAAKDAEEMGFIREAVRRAEASFLDVGPYIKAGAAERAIALRLEERLKKRGCRRIPFDIIVASGPNSAMPHARATERRLGPGDLVIVDWGGEAEGYFSDMTRTLLLDGNGVARKKEIYNLVLRANGEGIKAIRAGATAAEIDRAARGVIDGAGYGKHFGHSLGHGVGLQVHELPSIMGRGKKPVREGMVFTIEPGIYIPGIGGVRIEDMAAVVGTGAEVLTTLPKGLRSNYRG